MVNVQASIRLVLEVQKVSSNCELVGKLSMVGVSKYGNDVYRELSRGIYTWIELKKLVNPPTRPIQRALGGDR